MLLTLFLALEFELTAFALTLVVSLQLRVRMRVCMYVCMHVEIAVDALFGARIRTHGVCADVGRQLAAACAYVYGRACVCVCVCVLQAVSAPLWRNMTFELEFNIMGIVYYECVYGSAWACVYVCVTGCESSSMEEHTWHSNSNSQHLR